MSDGITDANRMTLHDIEIWRQRTKEEFVSKLTKKELIDELCKREGVSTHIVDAFSYGRVFVGLHANGEVVSWETYDTEATILVVRG